MSTHINLDNVPLLEPHVVVSGGSIVSSDLVYPDVHGESALATTLTYEDLDRVRELERALASAGMRGPELASLLRDSSGPEVLVKDIRANGGRSRSPPEKSRPS